MSKTQNIVDLANHKRNKLISRAQKLPINYKPSGYKRFGTPKPQSRFEFMGACHA